ncbi:alpha-tocopherol transfer protein-like [Anticarsia gemmatalis]|uniref:alpha-tocopherol transfer protein-like n=1 Tax=Anticarsia gemmatalis TaxID=129554 RepID=UPI003F764EC6
MEKSPQEIEKQVEQLRDWVLRQPHLPNDLGDMMVRRFLHSCYYDMEAAKKTVELFFNLRATSPELMNFRDPDSPQMQKTLKIVNLAQYQVAGKKSIWIWQLNDPGLENYDYLQDARLFFMITDAWWTNNCELADSDYVILDVKDITLKFITKFNVSIAKKLAKYQEEAMPIRLKGIHIVNAPPFIDKLFGLMKPFLKQDMTDMIHFHTPKSDTLYNYISKEDLPEDYGGSLPSMNEYMDKAIEVVKQQKPVFLAENFWKAEKKAKGAVEVGTFRTLDID